MQLFVILPTVFVLALVRVERIPFRCSLKGFRTEEVHPVRRDLKQGDTLHFPKTQQYNPDDVITDLLNLAAKCLKIGGRLVFLFPTGG